MKRLVFFLTIILSVSSEAQLRQLHLDHLTIEEGMPENRVICSLQDNFGYIWMGTQNGLVRYDGYEVRVYKLETQDKKERNFCIIYSLFEDKKGNLWVGTLWQGLFRYNRSTDNFTAFPHGSSQLAIEYNEEILSIAEDKAGFIWTMNFARNESSSHLDRFDPKAATLTSFDSTEKDNRNIPAKTFNFLLSDASGNIWVGTNNGLFLYDPAVKKFHGYLIGEDVRYIYEAPSLPGILWLSTWNTTGTTGLTRFNTKNGSRVNYLHATSQPRSLLNDSVLTVFEDHEKRLWIGTAQGLSLLNPQTETFTSYITGDKNEEPGANNCYDIKADRNGALWVLSGKGLLYLSSINAKLQRFAADQNEPNGLPSNTLYTTLIDRNGMLWMGTWGFGMLRVNEHRSHFEFIQQVGKNKGYPGGTVRAMGLLKDGTYLVSTSKGLFHCDSTLRTFEHVALLKDKGTEVETRDLKIDKAGIAWIGSSKHGLFRYDLKTKEVKQYLNDPRDSTSLSHNYVRRLYEDRQGQLWLGTWGGGLCLLDKKTGTFRRLPFIVKNGNTSPHGALDDDEVMAFFEDKKGALWVGTNKGGLNRYNEHENSFTSYYDPDNGLLSVNAIHEDQAGRFWVGTNLWGLFLFDREKGSFKRFREKEGLVYDNVESITEESSGQLWISSARGYSIMNLQNFQVKQLTMANGLPHNELTDANLVLPDGTWLTGTSNGIIRFEPGTLVANPVPPEVYLQTVTYTKQGSRKSTESVILLNGQKKLELAHNENRIVFQFVGIHYSNPLLNKYKYQLVGYDKGWIMAGTQRAVTYTNLSPGTYSFHVKASNSDGVWSEKDAILTVVINPPWWKTWWAYTLYVIAIIFLIWTFIIYRSRTLKRENKILEEKVEHRTVQLTQSLENLKATQAQLIQSEKMASLGELTAGIAHEIQNPLNFVNNFSDVNKELLTELKDEIKKGNTDEANAIANDVIDNEEKINHHGKRADAIVKGMLQHSRKSEGKKEPTDINALCDEYLRLSYHGMKAKDKAFSTEIKTDFDESIGKINIVPQDIGRVLLNLFNNAFYAVNEKAQLTANNYRPTAKVTTKKLTDYIEIKVEDNGNGIPQNIIDKIFQPFFTTKPTGQGTGLGLSLAYDIITKEHNGIIKVESKDGEGTMFIIQLINI